MSNAYLLAGQASELERLQLQSRVWEPCGAALLDRIDLPAGARAVDVGCGAMGWLRILSRKLGPGGSVIGTDVDDRMLQAASGFVQAEQLSNVTLVKDDLFASQLPSAAFDLVHARFQLAPLGRPEGQLDTYCRLLAPGGWLVLEEPDAGSWRIQPQAAAVHELIGLLLTAFQAGGGDFDAGRHLPAWIRQRGMEPEVNAVVLALEPGHSYLRLPLQFATALKARLEKLLAPERLDALLKRCEDEIGRTDAWGLTFTLVQAWAQHRVP
jgi:SAM-dependent methyltransferase